MHGVGHGAFFPGLQALEQGGHVAGFVDPEQVEGFRGQDVDTGVDVAAGDGLFLETDNVHAPGLHDAEGMAPFMRPHRHRRRRFLAHVEIQQFAVVDVGQYIAIGDDEGRFWLLRHQTERAGGTERGLFPQIFDTHLQSLAVAEVLFDHLAQVVNRQQEVPEAVGNGALDDVFQHRLAAYWEHGLGAVLRVRAQPGALATGHDHHQVGSRLRGVDFIPEVQADDPAALVHHGDLLDLVGYHQLHDSFASHFRGDDEGIAMDDRGDRAAHVQPTQQTAADITIGNGAFQFARFADDQNDLNRHLIQIADGVLDGGGSRQEGAAPDFFVGAHEASVFSANG